MDSKRDLIEFRKVEDSDDEKIVVKKMEQFKKIRSFVGLNSGYEFGKKYNICGVDDEGTLMCVDHKGQPTTKGIPQEVPTSKIIDIASSEGEICLLHESHYVLCWGRDISPSPHLFQDILSLHQYPYGCFLKTNGRVQCSEPPPFLKYLNEPAKEILEEIEERSDALEVKNFDLSLIHI